MIMNFFSNINDLGFLGVGGDRPRHFDFGFDEPAGGHGGLIYQLSGDYHPLCWQHYCYYCWFLLSSDIVYRPTGCVYAAGGKGYAKRGQAQSAGLYCGWQHTALVFGYVVFSELITDFLINWRTSKSMSLFCFSHWAVVDWKSIWLSLSFSAN